MMRGLAENNRITKLEYSCSLIGIYLHIENERINFSFLVLARKRNNYIRSRMLHSLVLSYSQGHDSQPFVCTLHRPFAEHQPKMTIISGGFYGWCHGNYSQVEAYIWALERLEFDRLESLNDWLRPWFHFVLSISRLRNILQLNNPEPYSMRHWHRCSWLAQPRFLIYWDLQLTLG